MLILYRARSFAYRSTWQNNNWCDRLAVQNELIERRFLIEASASHTKPSIGNRLGLIHIFMAGAQAMNTIVSNLMNSFSVYQTEDLIAHIRQHLSLLLNSRQQSVSHLAAYGIYDLHHLLSRLPESETEICAHLQRTIERYEPRLSHMELSAQSADGEVLLEVRLHALLKQRIPCQFTIRFDDQGGVTLN